uniref:Uncharacterized protein n=1 Tax=viral metagenome TaxID=1070528 RepID=A0A6C0BN37_9ZZZZ
MIIPYHTTYTFKLSLKYITSVNLSDGLFTVHESLQCNSQG